MTYPPKKLIPAKGPTIGELFDLIRGEIKRYTGPVSYNDIDIERIIHKLLIHILC